MKVCWCDREDSFVVAGIGGGGEGVTGCGLGRDVVVRGLRRSFSAVCGSW